MSLLTSTSQETFNASGAENAEQDEGRKQFLLLSLQFSAVLCVLCVLCASALNGSTTLDFCSHDFVHKTGLYGSFYGGYQLSK